VNRRELQDLARLRVEEARVLLEAGRWDGAYYLGGYAVECALKACIAKRVRRHDFPDRDLAIQSYTHNLSQLVRVAGLEPTLQAALASTPALAVNWAIVKDWAERSRYERRQAQTARELYAAIVDRRNGVLPWIRRHW
jgi:HEPN domain-containing protein